MDVFKPRSWATLAETKMGQERDMRTADMRVFWDALERAGIGSLQDFRDVWLRAVRQDPAAQKTIFKVTQESPLAYQKVNAWAAERVQYLARQRALRDEDKKKTVVQKKSQWEKSRDKLSKRGAWVIAGGLPSLGKKSR